MLHMKELSQLHDSLLCYICNMKTGIACKVKIIGQLSCKKRKKKYFWFLYRIQTSQLLIVALCSEYIKIPTICKKELLLTSKQKWWYHVVILYCDQLQDEVFYIYNRKNYNKETILKVSSFNIFPIQQKITAEIKIISTITIIKINSWKPILNHFINI